MSIEKPKRIFFIFAKLLDGLEKKQQGFCEIGKVLYKYTVEYAMHTMACESLKRIIDAMPLVKYWLAQNGDGETFIKFMNNIL